MINRVAVVAVIGLFATITAFFIGKSQRNIVYLPDPHSLTLSQENTLLRSQLLTYQVKDDRNKVLADAHFIGVSVAKYIVDHDKVPSTANVIAGCLAPYEEGGDIVAALLESKRLAYIYPGSPIDLVNYPRSIEIGYIYGNGGKAHIYMDGSVRWGSN